MATVSILMHLFQGFFYIDEAIGDFWEQFEILYVIYLIIHEFKFICNFLFLIYY